MTIADIKNTVARRIIVVLAAPLLLLVCFVLHIAGTVEEYSPIFIRWAADDVTNGMRSTFASIRRAWHGQ